MAEANPNSMSAQAEGRAAEIDLSNFTTQVDDTYHALRGFNFLMDSANEYAAGGISGTIAYGVSHLLRRQIDDLEEIRNTTFDLVRRLETAEKAAAGARQDPPDDFVILPTYRPGLEHELRARPDADPNPMDRLRDADLGRIARDTNLKEETVRRVLERLLADPEPQGRPAVSNG